MAATLPKLYNAWFCPFAQRAWIALLEKGVEFEYIEQNPYNKTPEWLAINPRGLVPTIIHNGKSIYESGICVQYVDEAWQTDVQLLPTDPYERAHVRILADYLEKKIIPAFYRLLLKKEELEQSEAKKAIVKGLTSLFEDFDKTTPFFGGQTLNLVDIMLAPFAYRFQLLLPHYRGFDIPSDSDLLQRYHSWYAALSNHDSFKKTLPEDQKLIQEYKRYADDSATSLVAKAIRKGTGLP